MHNIQCYSAYMWQSTKSAYMDWIVYILQGRSKRSGWSGFGRTNNRAGRNFVLTAQTTQSLFGVYSSATVLQQAPIVNNLKPFSLYFC